jgi:2,3-bisphosphoglycerate-independent phosphoglycerate mutase
MIHKDGTPHTSHTGSLVPFVVYHNSLKDSEFQKNEGEFALMDVSSTVLYVLGESIPQHFEGRPIFL